MSILLVSIYDLGKEWQQRWPEVGADTSLCVWPEHGSKDEVEMIAIDTVPPEGLLQSFPKAPIPFMSDAAHWRMKPL